MDILSNIKNTRKIEIILDLDLTNNPVDEIIDKIHDTYIYYSCVYFMLLKYYISRFFMMGILPNIQVPNPTNPTTNPANQTEFNILKYVLYLL